MKLFRLTICSLLIIGLRAEWNISEVSPGFIFEPECRIELIAGSWRFLTSINLTSYFAEISYAEEIVGRTTNYCVSLQNAEMTHHFGESSGLCNGLITELNYELSELKENNEYILNNSKRSKRGAINIIGHGLKFLFGTMDTSDADAIFKHIHEFDKSINNIVSDFNNHTTVLESTIEKLNETIDNMNKHTTLIHNLTEHVNRLNSISNKQLMYNQVRFLFDELSTYTGVLLNKIRRDQTKLFDITLSSRRGLIHDSLLNPEMMLKEMQSIQLSLRNLRFPLHISKINLYKIINLSKFIAFELDNIIIFNIIVPLTNNRMYTTYNLINVPTRVDNIRFTFTRHQHSVVAISEDKDQYFPLHQKIQEECKHIRHDEYLCEQPSHIYRINVNQNCETSSFIGSPINCEQITKTITNEFWISLKKLHSYLFIVPEPISIWITCHSITETIQINGTGLLFTSGCTIETPSIILPGSEISTSQANSEFRLPARASFSTTKTTPFNSSVITESSYMEYINQNNKPETENQPIETSYIIISIFVIFTTISICLLCIFAIWLYRGAKKTKESTETDTENH